MALGLRVSATLGAFRGIEEDGGGISLLGELNKVWHTTFGITCISFNQNSYCMHFRQREAMTSGFYTIKMILSGGREVGEDRKGQKQKIEVG